MSRKTLGKLLTVLIAPLFIGFLFLGQKVYARCSSCDCEHKIKICHANEGVKQYTLNCVDKNSTAGGHDGHAGDIIPVYTYYTWECPDGYTEHGQSCRKRVCVGHNHCWYRYRSKIQVQNTYPGKNWDTEGQAIWNNGCVVPSPSPTPTVTSSPTSSPTTSPSPTPSPTISPSPTETSSPEPTDSPRPTETSSPEPTPYDACDNIDGVQSSLPEGMHYDNDGDSCLTYSVPGVPEPTGGEVLGTSTEGSVLGASTMAGTGVVGENMFYTLFAFGSLLTSLGIMKYGKKEVQL
jgi:hypothetical protein